jgi:predicted dehydrogenase
VIEHPDVEAVSITAPNRSIVKLPPQRRRRGKHIWIEKPAGRIPQDTADIAEAVERADVRSIVGFNYRHAPAVRHARRLIDAGGGGTTGLVSAV